MIEDWLVTFSPNSNIICSDAIQVAKLRQLGLSGTDESKLIALREYTLKLAMTTLRWVYQSTLSLAPPHSHL